VLHVFRYTLPSGGEHLDITFNNIRHAIFQSAEKELITLVHFHLMNPIMVGKKKVKDVQFYTEVMNDTAAVRPSHHPPIFRPPCTPSHHVAHAPLHLGVCVRCGCNHHDAFGSLWGECRPPKCATVWVYHSAVVGSHPQHMVRTNK
jgi:hypothetical protein